jgi:hypothetical protein
MANSPAGRRSLLGNAWRHTRVALPGLIKLAAQGSDSIQILRAAEIVGFHQLCGTDDRKACVRFGIRIGCNERRNTDWRRTYANRFRFER